MVLYKYLKIKNNLEMKKKIKDIMDGLKMISLTAMENFLLIKFWSIKETGKIINNMDLE